MGSIPIVGSPPVLLLEDPGFVIQAAGLDSLYRLQRPRCNRQSCLASNQEERVRFSQDALRRSRWGAVRLTGRGVDRRMRRTDMAPCRPGYPAPADGDVAQLVAAPV